MLTFINFAEAYNSTGKTPRMPYDTLMEIENNPNRVFYLVMDDSIHDEGRLVGVVNSHASTRLGKIQHGKALFTVDLFDKKLYINKLVSFNPVGSLHWNSFFVRIHQEVPAKSVLIDLNQPEGRVRCYGRAECFYDAFLCYKRCLELNIDCSKEKKLLYYLEEAP